MQNGWFSLGGGVLSQLKRQQSDIQSLKSQKYEIEDSLFVIDFFILFDLGVTRKLFAARINFRFGSVSD